jgi:ParB/RepB/Spo0J family partition protein
VSNEKRTEPVQTGAFKQFSHGDLKPNPQNPRRLFDEEPLKVLEESIRSNGILVPLTVYQDKRTRQHYILDGERRWRCAELIETGPNDRRPVPIPANVVAPPTPVANMLWMFNIHNLREQWELMPTALSLKVIMDELGQTDDKKLAEITKLSEPNVRRCKILLSYAPKYHEMMLDVDLNRRIKANFFIELRPVLELYMNLPKARRGNKDRDALIGHFLTLYKEGKIASVIHFRRILEAYDYIRDGGEVNETKEERFLETAQKLASSDKHTIRELFDPLTTEGTSVSTAASVCKAFLVKMRGLKLAHVLKRAELRKSLLSVRDFVDKLLVNLEA